jgi:hypothetical protein
VRRVKLRALPGLGEQLAHALDEGAMRESIEFAAPMRGAQDARRGE